MSQLKDLVTSKNKNSGPAKDYEELSTDYFDQISRRIDNRVKNSDIKALPQSDTEMAELKRKIKERQNEDRELERQRQERIRQNEEIERERLQNLERLKQENLMRKMMLENPPEKKSQKNSSGLQMSESQSSKKKNTSYNPLDPELSAKAKKSSINPNDPSQDQRFTLSLKYDIEPEPMPYKKPAAYDPLNPRTNSGKLHIMKRQIQEGQLNINNPHQDLSNRRKVMNSLKNS